MQDYFTPQEVADYTGYKISSVWRWLRDERLDFQKISGRVYLVPKNEKNLTFLKERIANKK